MALQQQSIELEDAIDLREIKNIKLANQLLKIRRNRKELKDQAIQQQNMQMQSEANQQATITAAQAEMQKQEQSAQIEINLEQSKAELKANQLMLEANLKKELMEQEFMYNMQLRQAEMETVKTRDQEKEDRKDQRTKIQATQQSEMIDQRKNEKPPKNFESTGNDILGGDFDLGAFEPR
jgi:hypothetical protein